MTWLEWQAINSSFSSLNVSWSIASCLLSSSIYWLESFKAVKQETTLIFGHVIGISESSSDFDGISGIYSLFYFIDNLMFFR